MTAPFRLHVPDGAPPIVVITPRQADVLTGLCEGLSNADIGARLYITEDTVKTHVRRLLPVLGARSRCHAVALVLSGQVRVLVHDPKGRWAA
jgi:two-component system nitrate/nitrite response regulator NarL